MDLEFIVSQADAGIDRADTDLATIRAQQAEGYDYYYRQLPAKRFRLDETGQPTDKADGSQFVSGVVWDAVEAAVTAATDAFSATRQPVQFTPAQRPDVEEANDFARTVFYEQNNGTDIIRDSMQRAGIAKVGPVAVFWDETIRTESYQQELPPDMLPMLQQMSETGQISITNLEPTPEGMVRVEFDQSGPRNEICIDPIDPENFGLDGVGLSPGDWNVVYHHEWIRADELIAQGYPEEEIRKLPIDTSRNRAPRHARNSIDRSSRHTYYGRSDIFDMKLVTHVFVRTPLQRDGGDIQTVYLRYGRDSGVVLDAKVVEDHFYAVFEIYPVAGKAFGQSIADALASVQDSESHSIREILNNIYLSNRDRTEIDITGMAPEERENARNAADMIGGTYMVRRPGSIQHVARLPLPQETLPAIEYLQRQAESRTGYSRVAQGMNPDAIAQQNAETTVDKYIQLGSRRMGEIIRHNAEGALTRIYRLIYDLAVEHSDVLDGSPIEVNGSMRQIMPSQWAPNPSISIKPVLTRDERAGRAQGLISWDQMMIARMKEDPETRHTYQAHNAAYVYQEIADLLGFPIEKVMTTQDDPRYAESVQRAEEEKARAQAMEEQQMAIQAQQAELQIKQIQQAMFAETQKNIADIQRGREKQDLEDAKFDWQRYLDQQELQLEKAQERQVQIG